MKVILDTNVFLSALISPHGTANIIYRAWRTGKFEIVTSKTQLDEIRKASRYPKLKAILQPILAGTLINNLQHAIILKKISAKHEAKDPYDTFLLNMATDSNADYLVTSDRRAGILELKKIGRTRIVTPALFCKEALK